MILDKLFKRVRCRPVVYDSGFFSEAWFREWETLREVFAVLLGSEPKWCAILDFGCGPGAMIDLMAQRGLDYVGCDFSAEARQLYLERFGRHPERYVSHLEQLNDRKFDLLLALDVLEHMRDDEIVQLLEKARPISELLFNISRARGIRGHINIKSDRAWIAYMKKHGCRFEKERTDKLRRLYAQLRPGSPDQWDKNLFLFSRSLS